MRWLRYVCGNNQKRPNWIERANRVDWSPIHRVAEHECTWPARIRGVIFDDLTLSQSQDKRLIQNSTFARSFTGVLGQRPLGRGNGVTNSVDIHPSHVHRVSTVLILLLFFYRTA
jgi:hypothetical protein